MTKLVSLVLAYLFLALAVVGLFLPVMPTVPFLLLAAWFSAKGSKWLHRWLHDHPHFGKILSDWEKHGAISRWGKGATVVTLGLSWLLLYFRLESWWGLAAMAILFLAVISFVVSRPDA